MLPAKVWEQLLEKKKLLMKGQKFVGAIKL